MPRARLRDLGIVTGTLPPGPWNAITDVSGVRVGFTTLVRDQPSVVRTGVTAIWPRGSETLDRCGVRRHPFVQRQRRDDRLGMDRRTGPARLADLHHQHVFRRHRCATPICALAVRDSVPQPWLLPVVAETYDGWLSDAPSFPITTEHAIAALDKRASGPLAEGNVGGGTGMICHEFKGGTGTASRVVQAGGRTLHRRRAGAGELWQPRDAAHRRRAGGARNRLRQCGFAAASARCRFHHRGAGHRRAVAADPVPAAGAARHDRPSWVGGIGFNGSGDIFLAFATGNHVRQGEAVSTLRMLSPDSMNPLFQAAAEATEEAILNALTSAETMTGRDGHTAHALPLDRLMAVMRRYRPAANIARPRL